jgi:hypothetical protein
MGGSEDTNVDVDPCVAADSAHVALGEDAQELCLELERELADLVDEDGAAGGRLEGPGAGPVGPREGAAFVAEELRFPDPTTKRCWWVRKRSASSPGRMWVPRKGSSSWTVFLVTPYSWSHVFCHTCLGRSAFLVTGSAR